MTICRVLCIEKTHLYVSHPGYVSTYHSICLDMQVMERDSMASNARKEDRPD